MGPSPKHGIYVQRNSTPKHVATWSVDVQWIQATLGTWYVYSHKKNTIKDPMQEIRVCIKEMVK